MKFNGPDPSAPLCHRCKKPMAFLSTELAGDKQMRVYQCETCKTYEAFEEKLAP